MASAHAQRLASIYTANQLAAAGAQNTDLLNAGYAKGRTDLVQNANEANIALDNGHNEALGALGTNYDNARGDYAYASTYYQPYVDSGAEAMGAYKDLTGLNGGTGYQRATQSFRASPGYQYSVDQATDQVARKASALGALGSGNTMAAISDRAGNMADQEFGTYANRLQGLTQLGYGATNAQAGLIRGAGDLYAQQGNAEAALDNSDGVAHAAIRTGLGQGLSGQDTGLAQNLANTNMSVATGQGAAVTGAAQATDAAKNANQNLMLGVLGLGLKGASMFSGGLGGLGGLFGGGGGSMIGAGGTSWT